MITWQDLHAPGTIGCHLFVYIQGTRGRGFFLLIGTDKYCLVRKGVAVKKRMGVNCK